MDKGTSKEGVTVKEIGSFTKKHRFEVFFCLVFILATIFTFAIWGPGWSIVAAGIGAVLGTLLATQVGALSKKVFQFLLKHESTTLLVLAIIFLILSIFLPPLFFLILGLHGGRALRDAAIDAQGPSSRG